MNDLPLEGRMGIPQTNPAEPRKTGRVVNPFTAAEDAAEHFKRRGLGLSDVTQLKLTLVDPATMKEELGFDTRPRVRADRIPFPSLRDGNFYGALFINIIEIF